MMLDEEEELWDRLLAHTKEERRGGVGVQILFIRKGKLALKVF